MKTWREWIMALMIVCAAQVGLTNVEEETTAQAEPTEEEISEELAAAIAEIEANFLDADERVQRIALLIAHAVRSGPMGSASGLADLSRRVSATVLPVVSAAAIMSSGTSSPAVLRALVDAQGDDTTRAEAVRRGATNPVAILGTQTAALMQPVELQPHPSVANRSTAILSQTPTPESVAAAPAPATVEAVTDPKPPAAVVVAVSQPVEATPLPAPKRAARAAPPPADPPTLLGQARGAPPPQPPPPQPPGLPPRPPSLPYRGQ